MGSRPAEPVRRFRRARHLSNASRGLRLQIIRPLGIRDFAFLWAGASVSLLGDGVYVVALAWQVYELSNAPTALSLVGVAWTLPLAIFLLFGGVLSDRMDRRRILVAADVVRGLAVAAIGILSLAGAIELWHLIALAAVFGTGEAFFGPAFSALVPQIVPRHLLVEANSLDQFLRPFAFNLAGPALGGLIVATLGAGEAFLLDAMSFALSAAAFVLMRPRPSVRSGEDDSSTLDDIREGLRFVRSRVWLWGTLIAAAIALLAYWGPFEVLVPYVVKNELGGGADSLGLCSEAAASDRSLPPSRSASSACRAVTSRSCTSRGASARSHSSVSASPTPPGS